MSLIFNRHTGRPEPADDLADFVQSLGHRLFPSIPAALAVQRAQRMLLAFGCYRHHTIDVGGSRSAYEPQKEVLANAGHVTRDDEIPFGAMTQGGEHSSRGSALGDGIGQYRKMQMPVSFRGTDERHSFADARKPLGDTFHEGPPAAMAEQGLVRPHPAAPSAHEHEARRPPHAKIITLAPGSACRPACPGLSWSVAGNAPPHANAAARKNVAWITR